MEHCAVKRVRSRKRKRHTKKRREQVRSIKRRKLVANRGNVFIAKEKLGSSTMQGIAFWENYNAAHEWQKRHSIVWWKSRCSALEYENQILRNKLRSFASQCSLPNSLRQKNKSNSCDASNYDEENVRDGEEDEEEEEEEEEEENLEFQVNEDMLSFLEQSIKHKQELQKKRDKESSVSNNEEDEKDAQVQFQSSAELVRVRNTEAKLLYGDASSKILAMEIALEATVNRHKERAKPQYWPHVPLKP